MTDKSRERADEAATTKADSTRFELQGVTQSGQIEGRLIGLLRRPIARLAVDGAPMKTVEGELAVSSKDLDDPEAGVFSAAAPAIYRDDALRKLTATNDRGEVFGEASLKLPRQVTGRITSCDLSGAVTGEIEVSGLRTSSLAARLVANGEVETPFLLGPGDMTRDETAGVTRFAFQLRLPAAARTGAPAALALILDEAEGPRILDEKAFQTRAPAQGRPFRRARVKRLIIVETSLTEARGHMIAAIDVLARAARGLGLEPLVVGHKKFDGQEVSGVSVIGAFSRSLYDIASMSGVGRQLGAFESFKDDFAAGLNAVIEGYGADETLFIYPTVNEYLMSAIAATLDERDFAGGEHHLICLMLETGLLRQPGRAGMDDVETLDPVKVELFRDAFAVLEPGRAANRKNRLGDHVHIAAISETHRANYQELSAGSVHLMPPMYGYARKLDQIRPALGDGRQALLYLGEAKADKGFLLAPAVARALLAKHPDLRLAAQIHNLKSPEARAAADELRALEGPNLRLVEGFLDRDEYMGLLAASDAVVMAYSAKRYAAKTSGVFWEATSFAAPIVVPARSWLEQEAARTGGVYESFAKQTAEDIAAATERLLAHAPSAAARAPVRDMFANVQAFLNDMLSTACARPMALAELFDPNFAEPNLRDIPEEGRLADAAHVSAADETAFAKGWGAVFQTEFQRPGRWMGETGVIRLDIDRDAPRALRIAGERLARPEWAEELIVSVDGLILDDVEIEIRNVQDFVIRAILPPRAVDAAAAPSWIELSLPLTLEDENDAETLLVNSVAVTAPRSSASDA